MISPRLLPLILLAMLSACGKPAVKAPKARATTETTQPATKPALTEATQVASLIDPAKLATLGERGANPRVLKIAAILYKAKAAGRDPVQITGDAINQIGWGSTEKGRLTAAAMLRNLTILERLGSTTPEDLTALRRGHAPTVRQGPYAGDIVSVDHIIPRAIAPELDNVIANLELMPLRVNQSKNDKIGDRQRDLAGKLHTAGLLADPAKVR